MDFLKSKYNALINSDVKIREFNMYVYNKNHRCFIIYIDGMVSSKEINDYVLKPLLLKNSIKMKFSADSSAESIASTASSPSAKYSIEERIVCPNRSFY